MPSFASRRYSHFAKHSHLAELAFLSGAAIALASPKLSSIVELELRPIGTVCAGLSADLRNRG
jgi:hypothetical protein